MSKYIFKATIVRTPIKNIMIAVLILLSSFLFSYDFLDYIITEQQYSYIYSLYHGTVSVQHAHEWGQGSNYFTYGVPYFFFSDPASNPAYQEDQFTYAQFHQKDLSEEEYAEISSLPYISESSPRYMTAGISEYERLYLSPADVFHAFFPFSDRVILEATLDDVKSGAIGSDAALFGEGYSKVLQLSNVKILAGKEKLLEQSVSYIDYKKLNVFVDVVDAEKYSGTLYFHSNASVSFQTDAYIHNVVTDDMLADLTSGERYVFVCRVDRSYASSRGISSESGFDNTLITPFVSVGDESICNIWPYFTPLVGENENYLSQEKFAVLRKLMEVTEADCSTLDVVYTDRMDTIKRYQEGKLLPIKGRFLTKEDSANHSSVCVVSDTFADAYGLEIGDMIKLKLGDRLFEQYAPMGAVASSLQRYAENWTDSIAFEIVGTFAESGLRKLSNEDVFWAYGENAVFVPLSFLPVSEEALAAHRFKPSELSFVIGDAGSILPFKEECLPLLAEMGFTTWFYDGGWPAVEEQLTQAGELSLLKLGAFALAAVLALLLTVYLFILRKKKEFAILRALGCPAGQAKSALLLPLLALSVPAVLLGVAAAVIYTGQTAERNLAEFAALGLRVDASIPAWAVLAGLLGSLAILMGMALLALRRVARKPPLALLQDSAQRRARAEKAVAEAAETPAFTGLTELPPVRTRPHTGARHVLRYVFRHLRRTPLKASLSLALALILCFAMGFFTVLRDTYGALYQNIEILPRFINGFSYTRALEVEKSGFVAEGAYYEYVNPLCESNFVPDTLVLTNDLSRVCGAEVTYREGAGPELFGEAKVYCVVSRDLADALGLELGQRLELTVRDALSAIAEGNPTLGFEELLEIYHDNAVNTTIAGIAEEEGMRVYAPIAMWGVYKPLTGSTLALDYAEYRLLDYHQATAFRSYAEQKTQGSSALFSMDTTEADRIYQTYRLIETLYPIAFAVAILLGGVLPGIVILQSAREAALLRVLGTTKRRTRAMLGLEQVFLCVFGLALAVAALLAVNGAQLRAVAGLLAVYLAAHFAFCVSASGAAAVNVTKRGVLELLQVKE